MAPADEPGAIFSDWQFAGGQAWFVCDLRIPEGNQGSRQAGHRLRRGERLFVLRDETLLELFHRRVHFAP